MGAVRGKVKFFNDEKAYGFITRDDGRGDVFVHINDARKGGLPDIKQHDTVSFDVEPTPKGTRAVNLSRA